MVKWNLIKNIRRLYNDTTKLEFKSYVKCRIYYIIGKKQARNEKKEKKFNRCGLNVKLIRKKIEVDILQYKNYRCFSLFFF